MEELEDIQDVILRLDSSLPICRICLDVSMEYVELESPLCVINGEEITYLDAFHQLSLIVYDLPDRIPTNLCSSCGNDLLNTYLFLRRVENTNCILGKIKSLTKDGAQDTKADESMESFKVEILEEDKEEKCVELLSPAKLEDQATSEPSEPLLKESESHKEVSLEHKAEIIPKNDGAFDNQSSCDEEWFVGDEGAEIEELHAEHVNDSPIICQLCDVKFGSENELSDHLLYHKYAREGTDEYNNSTFCCKLCKQDFKSKALLMIHINVHRDRRKYKHSTAFQRKIHAKYRKHRSGDALPLQPNDFTCSFCGKKYKTAIGLKSHSRAHKERKFVCHICSKMCSTESTLKKHVDLTHLSNCKKYQCEDCGLVFKYPSYLKDHQRKHDTKSKYKCPYCERSYCRKPQFDIHLRYHNNDYRYKCNACDKCYATKSNLTDHIKATHIKITYDCDKCEQKFKSVTGLKKHKYSHTGYPYNCPLCLLGQASRSGIKTHIFGVHKGAVTVEEFNKMFPLVNPKSGYRRPKLKSVE